MFEIELTALRIAGIWAKHDGLDVGRNELIQLFAEEIELRDDRLTLISTHGHCIVFIEDVLGQERIVIPCQRIDRVLVGKPNGPKATMVQGELHGYSMCNVNENKWEQFYSPESFGAYLDTL